mmetsp:Transcript_28046/g.85681  ORF Transcript_28046/g.85681 Transcript_28046/m.85681 type:complete len:364 (-) Transcript_28046:410-1501(-)
MTSAILSALGSGGAMGALHALLGPDHVSAVLTLSVNRTPLAAGCLGLRWGLGHSIGLCVVTALFLILRDTTGLADTSLDLFEGGIDWVVGLIMLALGAYGYFCAFRIRWKLNAKAVGMQEGGTSAIMRDVPALQLADEVGLDDPLPPFPAARSEISDCELVQNSVEPTPDEENPSHLAAGPSSSRAKLVCDNDYKNNKSCGKEWTDEENDTMGDHREAALAPPMGSLHQQPRGGRSNASTARRCSCLGSHSYEAIAALGVGIVHGVGGPGGVLGVLPSLLMPGLASSISYILSFCAAATVMMGATGFFCGLVSSRSAERCHSPNLPWVMAAAAATLSVAVGIFWIVGSATGTLQDMLHSLGLE